MCSLAFASLQKDHNTESPFWWGYFVRRRLMARWAVMTGRSEFSMALGAGVWWLVAASCQAIWVWIKKKKKKEKKVISLLLHEMVVNCNDVHYCWVDILPAWSWLVLGRPRCARTLWNLCGASSVGRHRETTLWKAVLSGQIKTTVTFDVLRGWGNLSGLGSFSAFCCVIYYLGRKVWIIFLSFFFF